MKFIVFFFKNEIHRCYNIFLFHETISFMMAIIISILIVVIQHLEQIINLQRKNQFISSSFKRLTYPKVFLSKLIREKNLLLYNERAQSNYFIII